MKPEKAGEVAKGLDRRRSFLYKDTIWQTETRSALCFARRPQGPADGPWASKAPLPQPYFSLTKDVTP